MKHILIVEDDPGIVELMTIVLESAGYEVTSFPDGSVILKNNYPLPDVFLLDRQLPGIDGLMLCRHLKIQEKTKHIPVIMISASLDIEILAKKAMADDSLAKPFEVNQLREMVAKHLL